MRHQQKQIERRTKAQPCPGVQLNAQPNIDRCSRRAFPHRVPATPDQRPRVWIRAVCRLRFAAIVPTIIACAAMGADPAANVDWPHVRGPRFDGVFPRATALPAWPAGGPSLRWQVPLGQGFSGAVVAQGRVFTQHQTASGQELVCIDLASGSVVWRTRYAFPWEMDGRYPGPYATPTLDGDRVFFSDCYGTIGAARVSDGSILWRFDAVKKLNPAGVDFGYAAAPLALNGKLFVPAPAGGGNAPAGSAVVSAFCLDATTGALVWQSGTAFSSYASFSPLTVAGRSCLLLPLRNGVALFDPASGAELWRDEWTRGYDEHSCWPVYEEPFLFCPSAFRRAARVYRLGVKDEKITADQVWEERVLSNDVFASALVDGHLYGFDVHSQQSELLGRTRGVLKCIELATGAVRWMQTGIKHCSVTRVGSQLLLLEDEGDLVLVDPSPAAYRELARATLPQAPKIWAAPVIVGDRLIVRARDSIACYTLAADTGTTSASNAPVTAARTNPTGEPNPADRVRAWFQRHRTDAFIAPSAGTLSLWYGECLVLLIAAWALARVRIRSKPIIGWAWLAAAFGLAGTFALTSATHRFSFTPPLALFALFCLAVPACHNPLDAEAEKDRGIRSIARLIVFVALCVGYYQACGAIFLVAGWGFLAGFPAVVLLAAGWRRWHRDDNQPTPSPTLAWLASSFTVFFGASAVAILWHAN